MNGKMSALHKLFIDNMDNCRVNMRKENTSYIFYFNFNTSEGLYTITYEVEESQCFKQTLQSLYHIIRAEVINELCNQITG